MERSHFAKIISEQRQDKQESLTDGGVCFKPRLLPQLAKDLEWRPHRLLKCVRCGEDEHPGCLTVCGGTV